MRAVRERVDRATWVLVNAYSFKNAGDAAISISTARLFRDLNAGELVVSTRYYEEDRTSYERAGIRAYPAVLPFAPRGRLPTALRVVQFAWTASRALLIRYTAPRSRALARRLAYWLLPSSRIVLNSPGVVIAGGGYFYSAKRRFNLSLWYSLLTISFTNSIAFKTVMMPQSVGPLSRPLDQSLARWALTGIEPVAIRETESNVQNPMVLEGLPTSVVPDVALFGLGSPQQVSELGDSIRYVCVVAADWTWARTVGHSALDIYIANMAKICSGLVLRGFHVVLLGHSAIPEHGQDDSAICMRIFDLIRSDDVSIDSNVDVFHLDALYRRAEAVVGTRLHSCLMATSVGTPSLAIAYQTKALGCYTLLGLTDMVVDVEELTVDGALLRLDQAMDDAYRFEKASREAREALRQHYGKILKDSR
jgi:polysaccharide pyruvyl transferase WcaK-like protein